jgi:hypothetical protein
MPIGFPVRPLFVKDRIFCKKKKRRNYKFPFPLLNLTKLIR